MDNAFEKRKAESILLLSCFPFLWVIKKNETNEKDNIYKLQGHLTNLIIVYFILNKIYFDKIEYKKKFKNATIIFIFDVMHQPD